MRTERLTLFAAENELLLTACTARIAGGAFRNGVVGSLHNPQAIDDVLNGFAVPSGTSNTQIGEQLSLCLRCFAQNRLLSSLQQRE